MSGSTLYILHIECYIYVVSFDFGWINSFPCDHFREPGIPGDLNEPTIATVPVVHNILELKVSMQVSSE